MPAESQSGFGQGRSTPASLASSLDPALLDAIGDPVILIDADLLIARMNPAAARAAGRPAQASGGGAEPAAHRSWASLFVPDDQAAASAWAATLAAEGTVTPRTLRLTGPDGTGLALEWVGRASAAGPGGLLALAWGRPPGVETNLTQGDAIGLHMTILEAIPDLIFRMDRRGAYLGFHAPPGKPLLAAPSEFLGRTPVEVLPPHVAEPTSLALERLFRTGEPQRFEYAVDGPEGRRHHEVRLVLASGEEALALVRETTAMRRADEALRESEQRFQRFAGAVSEVFWMSDLESRRLVYLNSAFERIWGRPRGDLASALETWRESVHPEDRARVLAAFEAWAQGPANQPHQVEYRILRPDGELRWIHDTAFALRDGDPQRHLVAGVATDITDRRLAARALEEREQAFRTIFTHAPSGVALVDASGRIRLANRLAAAMFEADSADALAGLDLASFLPEGEREEFARGLAQAALGRSAQLDHEIRGLRGRRLHARTQAVPLPDPDGAVRQVMVILRDETARRQAEEELRASEERYRRIVETSLEGVWVVDAAWRTSFVNPRLAEMLGWPAEQIVGRHIFEFMDEEAQAQTRINMGRREAGLREQHEFRFRRRDGSDLWTILSTNPLHDGEGRFCGALAMVTDIGERKRYEAALLESQRILRSLIANLPGFVYRCRNSPEWPMEFLSPQAGEITGYAPADLIAGRPHYAELILPDDVDRVWRQVQESVEQRRPFQLLYRIRRADGAVRWVWEQGAGVFGEGSQPAVLEGFITDITERREAEEAMQREQRMFLGGPVVAFRWRAGPGWPVEYVSSNVEQFGYTAEQLMSGRVRYADLVHPDDVDRVLAEVIAHRDGGARSFEQQYRLRRADGAYVWLQDFTMVVRDARGQVTHYEGYVFDDTKRRSAEHALADSQRMLALLVRRSPMGVIVWNGDQTVREWNPAAASIFGYSEREARGLPMTALLPPRLRPAIQGLFQQLVTVGGDRRAERNLNENLTKDGREILVDWFNTPLVDDGRIIGVASMCQDVTAERLAQTEVARREQDLRLITNALPALISYVGADGRYVFANQAYERWLGVSAQALIGKTPHEVLPVETHEASRAHVEAVLAGRATRFETVIRTIEGPRHVDVSLVPRTEAGSVKGYYVLALDVTARNQAELELSRYREQLESLVQQRTAELQRQQQRLRQSEQLASLGTLAAGLGHDMNNMILPMRCTVDAFDPSASPEHQSAQIGSLRRSLEFLAHLSSGLLSLASAPDDAERGSARTNLARWWARDGAMLASAGRGVELRINLPAGLPDVSMAEAQLTRAILNLIVNAAEATGPGGIVDVWAREHADAQAGRRLVALGVTDNGPGMSPDVVTRALEPFFTTKRRTLSTGLGLSLVHALAQSVGGKVEIEASPGQGTTVCLLVPAAPPAPPPPEARQVPPRTARIAVADDRIAGFLGSLLSMHRIHTERSDAGSGPGDAAIWVVDGSTQTPKDYSSLWTKKIIVVGSASPEWLALGAILIPDGADVAAINAALRTLA